MGKQVQDKGQEEDGGAGGWTQEGASSVLVLAALGGSDRDPVLLLRPSSRVSGLT